MLLNICPLDNRLRDGLNRGVDLLPLSGPVDEITTAVHPRPTGGTVSGLIGATPPVVFTLKLARNARTSPEMIDRFYAAPLMGEMAIAELQSKRRPRPWER
jgi:hypothetical protein